MMVIVPRIKMRSALLHDDVDTGAGGNGSLHFYLPLPSITFSLDHLATFVRSELCNPAKHFLQPSPKLLQLLLSQVRYQKSKQPVLFSFLSNKCNEDLRSNNDLL